MASDAKGRSDQPGEPFSWRVAGREGDWLRVELRGEIDENADFSELRQTLRGNIELRLEGITRINSCGVREWVNFVRGLEGVRSLWFARCSPPVVLQLNTIYNFRGRARVSSFMAPYVCEACHTDEYKLLDVAEHFPDRRAHVPAFRCKKCGGVMVFDELPERYLSFLSEAELADPSGGG
ncbi:MAG: hypothetical protein JWN44_4639 [Myxococcales bacterium]|nr:hypothetical protein [Myxococcales bacterium]